MGPRDAPQLPARPHPQSRLWLALFGRGEHGCQVRFAKRQVRPPAAAALPEHHHERRRLRTARVFRPVHPARLRHPDRGAAPERPRRAGPLDARRLGRQPGRGLGQSRIQWRDADDGRRLRPGNAGAQTPGRNTSKPCAPSGRAMRSANRNTSACSRVPAACGMCSPSSRKS